MKKRLISLILALTLLGALTACSSSTSDTASDTTADTTAADTTETGADTTDATEAEGTTADDSDLAYIKENGKMVIGYTVYEPMNYTDENGVFTGFDTELATAVCEKLGVEPEFVEINWDTKETELAAKSIDCIWNGLTLTDEREENMACTEPYVRNAQVIVMKADANYSSTADLIGKTVLAEAGSAGEETIEEDENLSQADFVTKTVQTDCLLEVKAGTADAAVLDLTLASAMVGEGTDYSDLAIVDELNAEEYGVAFRKGSDVAAAVNEAFAELRADGTLQELADKYDLTLADAD
jgi:polar amino acid transport system substrate-binding protein